MRTNPTVSSTLASRYVAVLVWVQVVAATRTWRTFSASWTPAAATPR